MNLWKSSVYFNANNSNGLGEELCEILGMLRVEDSGELSLYADNLGEVKAKCFDIC